MSKPKTKTAPRQNCFLRLTVENKQFIEKMAQSLGISINAYMNMLITQEREK